MRFPWLQVPSPSSFRAVDLGFSLTYTFLNFLLENLARTLKSLICMWKCIPSTHSKSPTHALEPSLLLSPTPLAINYLSFPQVFLFYLSFGSFPDIQTCSISHILKIPFIPATSYFFPSYFQNPPYWSECAFLFPHFLTLPQSPSL